MKPTTWIVILTALATTTAHAHEEKYRKRDRMTISATAIRLALDYEIPAGNEARALKQLFDRNRSGSLEQTEIGALTDYLVRQTVNFIALTVDGQHIAPKLDRVTADPIAAGPDRVGLHIEMSAAVKQPHHIRLGDRVKDGRMNVPVEVVLEGLELAKPLPPQPFVFAEHPLDLDLK